MTLKEFLFKLHHLSYWSVLYVTPAHDLISSTQLTDLSQLQISSRLLRKRNFLERQRTEVSSRDVHVTSSAHAEYPPPDQSSLVVGWPFYNFKSSEPNRSASLFRRRNRRTFSYFWALIRATHSAIAMARPRAPRSLRQNPPPAGEDELARAALGASTDNSNTPSHTPAVSRLPTPAPAPPPAPIKLVAKYTNIDMQKATKLALESFVQSQ